MQRIISALDEQFILHIFPRQSKCPYRAHKNMSKKIKSHCMPGIRQETMDQILALVLLIGSINTAVKGIVAGADQEDINTSGRKSDMFYEMEELVNRILIKKGLTQNLIADMVALKDINSQQKLEIAGLKREITLLQDRQRSLLKAMEN